MTSGALCDKAERACISSHGGRVARAHRGVRSCSNALLPNVATLNELHAPLFRRE